MRNDVRRKERLDNISNKGNESTERETVGFCSRKGQKGQWFIVSAVVITTVFVALSGLLRDYFAADFVPTAGINEDFYFENVKEGIIDTIRTSSNETPLCASLEKNLTEFISFSTRKMAELGYVEQASFTRIDCQSRRYSVTLSLVSERFKKSEIFTT